MLPITILILLTTSLVQANPTPPVCTNWRRSYGKCDSGTCVYNPVPKCSARNMGYLHFASAAIDCSLGQACVVEYYCCDKQG
ncbi:hypothetical protein WAI453_006626 [Rhynchosporium graminicola]